MSEKHDRDDPAAPAPSSEPNPFAISPNELDLPPLGEPGSAEDGAASYGAPREPVEAEWVAADPRPTADLFETEDEAASVRPDDAMPSPEPPAEIDAAAQELQARPADVTPEAPKTIISEAIPAWPTWSEGSLPPIIIYGPTSFRRTPASVPMDPPAPPAQERHIAEAIPDARPPAPDPRAAERHAEEHPIAEPIEAEPMDSGPMDSGPMEAEPMDSGSVDTEPMDTGPVVPEPVAPEPLNPSPMRPELVSDAPVEFDEFVEESPNEAPAETPTLPADSTLMVEPAELDEIFDSIEAIADQPLDPSVRRDETSAGLAPDEVDASPDVYQGSSMDGPEVGRDHAPASDTAPGESEWTDVPAEADAQAEGDAPVEADRPAEADGPATWSGPATMSGQWPPTPATEDIAVSEAGSVEPAMPADAEPELAISEAALRETGEVVPVAPVITMDVEPSAIELAAIPEEPAGAIPLTAVAAGTAAAALAGKDGAADPHAVAGRHAQDASHGQTAAAFFAHAHDDVESRKGVLSFGVLTKLAGLSGLLACVAGLAMLLIACAGMVPFSEQNLGTLIWGLMWGAIGTGSFAALLVVGSFLFRSWLPSALLAAALALAMGGGWYAMDRYRLQLVDFNLLSISPYLTYVGLGGLAVALIGGWIEHRRLREETHVLAALFSNVLASAGGGVLWLLSSGLNIYGK